MLERERDNQSWIFDLMVKMTGRTHNFAYDRRDVPPEVKNYAMIPRVMERVARHIEQLAKAAEERGDDATAAMLYARCIHPYHLAQHAIYEDDDSEKIYLHAKLIESYSAVVRTAALPIETVEVPFGDSSIQAHFLRTHEKGAAPAILYCPGMDQTKEGYPTPLGNDFNKRGMHVLSIDGPGQGISNIRKLRLDHDNYEQAGRSAIDWLVANPAVDSSKVGVFGGGLGSNWAMRIAGTDDRVGAVSGAFAAFTGMDSFCELDSPRYKRILMYMSGLHDEETFDRFAAAYGIEPFIPHITCPTLMVNGEFDPMSDVDQALALFKQIPGGGEFWILEDQFHMPMAVDGLGGLDIYPFIADWFADVFRREGPPRDNRKIVLVGRDGIGPYGPAIEDHRLPARLASVGSRAARTV